MRRFEKYLKPFILILIFFYFSFYSVAGIMSRPRSIKLLKTQHFDILFSNESEKTAFILAENVEQLYETAKSSLQGSNDLHMPIVISPDSDYLSVEYTYSPYNRIVVFDGVPNEKDVVFQDCLLGLFYQEIYLALSQTIRSPFNQSLSVFLGDNYQPISLFYLPSSFVEARAILSSQEYDSQSESNGLEKSVFSDKQFLEVLSVAKYENKFPNWIQAGSERDIYPGNELNVAASSAFAAYLMQTFGVEKYEELWKECGNVNFVFTEGMFKKVYGKNLSDLWNDFEEAVPLPEDLEKIKELELETDKLLKNDTEGVFENLIISDYGLIWYDDIRHDVNIYDWNSKFKMKQMLFLASDVEKLSLSPDEKYLAVSFYGRGSRPVFKNDKTWIFDLQKRDFTKAGFYLRDSAIVELKDGTTVLAGINVKSKSPLLQIYNLDYNKNNNELLYEKKFNDNEYPNALVYGGRGKIGYILQKGNKTSIVQYDMENEKEKVWNILYDGQPIKIKNLRLLETDKTNIPNLKGEKIYTFEFFAPDKTSFSRMGLIFLNENYEPEKIYFQNMDVAGGVKNPVVYKNDLYYCARKFSHTEINLLPTDRFYFDKGDFAEVLDNSEMGDFAPIGILPSYYKEGDIFEKYEISKYNSFKHLSKVSIIPFMSIKDLATTKRQGLWPSLGFTAITQYDPFLNNRIMLSASWMYAKLDYKQVFNPTKDDITDSKKVNVDDNKHISAGISIDNTSTPVDFRGGCLLKFNPQGEYNFTTSINAIWQLPVGMAFSKFNFNIHSKYIASTDYYDRNLSDTFPSKTNWPSFTNAYEAIWASIGGEYTNIHQYGISKYQERGFTIGAKLYSLWDITEIRLLNKKYNDLRNGTNGNVSDLTDAQIKKLYDQDLLGISQLIFGLYSTVAIPKLLPIDINNGLVLCLPTTINAELFMDVGTAVHSSVETLLLGYECQNGFSFLYMFFSRLGLKFGYDLNLNYDTYKVPLPDIRKKNNLWNVFSNVYLRDSIYCVFNMDFCSAMGRLSEYQFKLSLKAEYFIRSQNFAFGFKFLITK